MSYATQDDIDARYPGALEQAGPRTADGDLDTDAVDLACAYADGLINQSFMQAGIEYAVPYPTWLIDWAVDIAMYRATPAPQAGDAAFLDRRKRYDDVVTRLRRIATGESPPPTAPVTGSGQTIVIQSRSRRGWGDT